jgi:hypothetical protein
MSGPNWKLENSLETLTITFPSTPPVAIQWKAPMVDEHLQKLGKLRAGMRPEIPKTFAPGQLVGAVSDPAWVTEPDAMLGRTLLHIRDPRFGWLHYLIPKEKARKLAGLLQAQADAEPPGQRGDKLN